MISAYAECPFYKSEKGLRLRCELGTLVFPDKVARRAVVYEYCAHPTNWKNCMLCKVLADYYERKETTENG